MKKIKISLLLLSIIAICKAQNPIPNGNFETWSSTGYEYPQYYQYNSIIRSLISNNYYAPNVEKTTDAYHGNYAVKLTTIAASQDTIFGYFLNTPPNEGDVNTWIGGAPINETPTGIRGYYKYNLATIDSATIIVSFSKMGVNIGTYIFKVGGITNSYLPFQFTFNPPLSVAPDSVVFAAVSSNIFSSNNGIPGACLYIDSISLLGITSQPAMLNGDFEYWQNNTLTYPNDWYMNNANEDNYGYISLTTDAAKGNYAIKLESYLEYDFDDVTWYTRPTQIATGYWDNGCGCWKGGYPFNNQVDTLTFWYKYMPTTNTYGYVYIMFNYNGNTVYGQNIQLQQSSTYQYVEVPFNIYTLVDTVIIIIQPSDWQDNLPSVAGTTMIIDEIQFKSSPLNTNINQFIKNNDNNVSIYPNPSNGEFYLKTNSDIKTIEIYNTTGELVYSKTNSSNKNNKINKLDLSYLKKGIYYIKLSDNFKTYNQKIIIQ